MLLENVKKVVSMVDKEIEPITVRDAYEIVFRVCAGDPIFADAYTMHLGKLGNWVTLDIDLECNYREIPQNNEKYPSVDKLWVNEDEESVIILAKDKRIRVLDYHDSDAFKEYVQKLDVEAQDE